MEYNRIMAITGMPGLFELLSSKTDGAIVRSLDDKSTKFVSSRVHNFSHLESIEVYTNRENVNLVEVFTAIQNNGGALPADKDAVAVKAFFQKVYPDMDFERVYVSDMKKMLKWYTVLKNNNVEIKLNEVPEEEVAVEEAPAAEPAKETKKVAAKVKEESLATLETEEKAPAKKATKAKKAVAEDGAEVAEKAPAKKTAKKTAAPKENADGTEEKPKKTTTRKKKTEE